MLLLRITVPFLAVVSVGFVRMFVSLVFGDLPKCASNVVMRVVVSGISFVFSKMCAIFLPYFFSFLLHSSTILHATNLIRRFSFNCYCYVALTYYFAFPCCSINCCSMWGVMFDGPVRDNIPQEL